MEITNPRTIRRRKAVAFLAQERRVSLGVARTILDSWPTSKRTRFLAWFKATHLGEPNA